MKLISTLITLTLLASCAQVDEQSPMPLNDGWNTLKPGGDTTCSDGTPYHFYVRPGDADKLMIYLQGGGACWFRENCDPNIQPTYTINLTGFDPNRADGVFNFERDDNPLKDYTMVFAPYCSADVHLGASNTVYPARDDGGEPLTVRHQGIANAQAVLDWTYGNLPDPETVFVAGSSAGSIPSPYYAMKVAEHYPEARVVQLGDGSGGYRRFSSMTQPYEQWGSLDVLAESPSFADLDPDAFTFEALYTRAAAATPNVQFAAYDAAEDAVQVQFLGMAGLQTESLQTLIEQNQQDIRDAVPGFRSFIAGGDSHTILGRPYLYTFRAGDVRFLDWHTALVNGEPVEDATCGNCAYAELVGAPLPAAFERMWIDWNSPAQAIPSFEIFDNVYYVGIGWVSAYAVTTPEGIVLIDALYGKWVQHLEMGLRRQGLNPADVRYVIATHGHFDHAGGARYFQERYGARVVMAQADWQLAQGPFESPYFAFSAPRTDIVAEDGDTISLGGTTFRLHNTPGHTLGVLSVEFPAYDDDETHQALTLGGVGLNFEGVAQTEQYIASYERLLENAGSISVSLPNHPGMGRVMERAEALASRTAADPHPFVAPDSYAKDLRTFLENARRKLEQEKAGTARSAAEELTEVFPDS